MQPRWLWWQWSWWNCSCAFLSLLWWHWPASMLSITMRLKWNLKTSMNSTKVVYLSFQWNIKWCYNKRDWQKQALDHSCIYKKNYFLSQNKRHSFPNGQRQWKAESIYKERHFPQFFCIFANECYVDWEAVCLVWK